MAFTRNWLRDTLAKAGVSEENIAGAVDELMQAHVGVVDALKTDKDALTAKVEAATGLQTQLDEANERIKTYGEMETKYNAMLAANTKAGKRAALKKALESEDANRDAIELLLDTADYESIELDDGGSLKDAAKIVNPIKEKHAAFFGETHEQGNRQPKPLGNPDTKKTNPQVNNLNDALNEFYTKE